MGTLIDRTLAKAKFENKKAKLISTGFTLIF